jgi:hypothetical protein
MISKVYQVNYSVYCCYQVTKLMLKRDTWIQTKPNDITLKNEQTQITSWTDIIWPTAMFLTYIFRVITYLQHNIFKWNGGFYCRQLSSPISFIGGYQNSPEEKKFLQVVTRKCRQFLEKHRVELVTWQLKVVMSKDPDLIRLYFAHN